MGADISKDKLDICFLTSNETKKPLYVSLPNDYETIKAYFKSFIKDNITIVFEYTNNYHIVLQSVLSDLKLRYSLLNPEKTSYFLKHLSHQKTDLKDSYGLALYCKIFHSELSPSAYNNKTYFILSCHCIDTF